MKTGTKKQEGIIVTHGYARCSTNETRQDIDRQVRELKAAGATKIWMEYEHGDSPTKEQQDKIMSENDIQMVPCCGHFLIANKDLSEVTISGCDNGLDWSVVHENGGVKLALPSGEEWVPLQEYQRAVIRFADKVEAYYKSCQPKHIPDDEFARNGYLAFWNEWHRRYAAAVGS